MSYTARHGTLSLLFFLLLHSLPLSTAQPTNPNDQANYATFSAPLAILLAVLIAALFFIGVFSIFIRNCSNISNTNGRAVNPVIGRNGRSRRRMRGLEASVIETFPTMVYSEVKVHKIGKGALECAVCLNEFEDDETLRLIPNCDHVFHPECIDAWLASHTTCPVCRANLAPQPLDSAASQPTESAAEIDLEAQNDTSESETEEERRLNNNNVSSDVEAQVAPEVNVIDSNRILNKNRTRGSRSSRSRKIFFPRSHTTGHSLVQPGQNTDRFTLRLPVDVRNQLISRELNRTSSLVLPKESSSRRGYRAGEGGGSSRGKSFNRIDKMDREVKSDRWIFTKSLSFFNRTTSIKSTKVTGNYGEGTSSFPVGPAADSSRPQL